MENAWKTDFTNAKVLVDPVIYREIFLKTNTNFFLRMSGTGLKS